MRMRKKEMVERWKKEKDRSETASKGTRRGISRHFQVSRAFSKISRCVIDFGWPRHFWPRRYRDLSCSRFLLHLSVSRFNSTIHVRNRLIERVDIVSVTWHFSHFRFFSLLRRHLLEMIAEENSGTHLFYSKLTNCSVLIGVNGQLSTIPDLQILSQTIELIC